MFQAFLDMLSFPGIQVSTQDRRLNVI